MREGEGRNAKDVFALKQLAVGDSQVDVLKHHVDLGSLKLLQPTMTLVREADGRLNLQRRMAAGDAKVATAVASVAPARTAKSAEGAWTVQIKDALIDGGQVAFTDLLMQRGADPVRVSLSELHLGVQGVAWPAQRTAAPAKVQLSTRIDRSAIERGKARARGVVEFKGGVGLEPMMASGKLRVERFPVQLFDPYVTKQLQVSLLRAEAGYKGDVFVQRRPAGLDVKLAGDVLIGDLSVVTKPEVTQVASAGNTEDLLAWQALAMKGLKFTMAPAVLPRLDIDDVAITDLDTKLIITEQGKLNLQTVAQTQAAASSASAASAPGSPAVKPSVPSAAPVTGGAASASSGADVGGTLPIDVRVGAVRLINGRVDFTDHFIRPNYSAVLSDLNGQVGSFSSGSRKLAEVALRGRVAGTGLLDIAGKLNPTVKPMALDIKAAATDLELAPLSAYSGKYAGYAIERGKLSVNVAYKIDPDGKLAASNQVVLNQLTFGDKVESKDATKLPVLFAVALLKDRDGVIDVNLPISGTVNDPKFSVGGIIWQVIVNLITRAVTAPFSLLTGGAGGKEHNQVEFVPGTIVMAPSGAEAIDKVARALVDRPSLKMTVTGTADPVREREAFQAATIDAKLLAEQRRENLRAGVPADAASAAPAALTTEERTRQLTRLYKATDVPGKPRNAIGFAKDIPVAEMEALLKPQIPVTDEAMRELALQRGLAVRDGLVAKGLPSDRLFLAAPKLGAPSASAASAAPAASGASGASGVSAAPGDAGTAWVPRAELSLSAK